MQYVYYMDARLRPIWLFRMIDGVRPKSITEGENYKPVIRIYILK